MDNKEFAKMFKISVPVDTLFDYYIETLSKSPEFSHLPALVEEFKGFEKWVKEHGYEHIGRYKKECLSKIKHHIEHSVAYTCFQEYDYSSHEFRTLDQRFVKSGSMFISIDIKSANFSTMKTFDVDNELGKSWEELCISLMIYPTLVKSKSFRQVVFGNLNPNRNGKIQLMKMNQLADALEKEGFDLAYISNDEVIVSTDNAYEDWMKLSGIATRALPSHELGVPLKLSVLKWVKADGMRKGEYLKERYNDYCHHEYNSLVGIPGQIFYEYFKKYIIKEELEDKDLYFTQDGRLAQWVK